MIQPSVSVVMPVYNPGKHLVAAIGSIVDQSFADWELICVDDGSTDGSPQVLEQFAKRDKRIRSIHQKNGGVVSAANRGYGLAAADWICRMDSDDVALPNMLEHQVGFMRQHPEHVAAGCAIFEMDVDSEPLGIVQLPQDHDAIVRNLLSRATGLFQPASILRKDAFLKVGGFRNEYQWLEDHDLWLRLSQVGRLANTHQVLLYYRQHASSASWQKSHRQREMMTELLRQAFLDRNMEPSTGALVTPPSRSNAGSGKWARKAARGGFPRTAQKHLKALWNQQGLSFYTARIAAEVLLRCSLAPLSRKPSSRGHVGPLQFSLPSVSKWEKLAA